MWIDSIKRIISNYIAPRREVVSAVEVPVLQNNLLQGRRAVVTGGSKGIGKAISAAFLSAGCEVAITGRNKEALMESVSELSNIGPKVFYSVIDNKCPETFDAALSLLAEKMGEPDILVNNAGINDYAVFPNVDLAAYDNVMDTNLRGSFFMAQTCAKRMIAAGIHGNILNICSASSLRPGVNPYCLSKWGIRAMTIGMAKILAEHGIVVNGLAPGLTGVDRIAGESHNLSWNRSPVGRMSTPTEIANMAVVMASSMGKMIVGDVVYMTGGSGVLTVDDNM